MQPPTPLPSPLTCGEREMQPPTPLPSPLPYGEREMQPPTPLPSPLPYGEREMQPPTPLPSPLPCGEREIRPPTPLPTPLPCGEREMQPLSPALSPMGRVGIPIERFGKVARRAGVDRPPRRERAHRGRGRAHQVGRRGHVRPPRRNDAQRLDDARLRQRPQPRVPAAAPRGDGVLRSCRWNAWLWAVVI